MALNISSNLVPEVINDYNVYGQDGILLIGLADEITLPKISSKKTTLSGSGILGEIDAPVPGQIESSEMQIKWNHLYSDAARMMNPNETVQITIRAAQQTANKEGGVGYKGLRIVCSGHPKEIDLGTLKRGDTMGATTTLELLTYKVEVDSQVIFDIDKLGGKYVVIGVDLRAEINALI